MLCVFFWVIPRRLNFICRRFGTLIHLHKQVGTCPSMKMEQTDCSETSAYKIQTPENYPEENTQHSEYGESLKSRSIFLSTRPMTMEQSSETSAYKIQMPGDHPKEIIEHSHNSGSLKPSKMIIIRALHIVKFNYFVVVGRHADDTVSFIVIS